MSSKSKWYLKEELSEIRLIKNLTLIPLLIFLACVIVFFVLKLLDMEAKFLWVYQLSFLIGIFGFAMTFVRSAVKCPNCENTFNRKEKAREILGLRMNVYAYNIFTRKCMNCGIKLNEKNLDDYHSDL